MIQDLDATLRQLLTANAPPGSLLASAKIAFDLPDADWHAKLAALTLNLYLYNIVENRDMRTNEVLLVRSSDGKRAARLAPPIRIDCAYCITAWSLSTASPVLEEHQLLSDVLLLLLQTPTIPAGVLQGSLVAQIPPYPTIVASTDAMKNHPEFWTALDQKLKPSLNYVVTLGMLLESVPTDANLPAVVQQTNIIADNKALVD